MKKLIVAFRNFVNAPKSGSQIRVWESVDCTRLEKNAQIGGLL